MIGDSREKRDDIARLALQIAMSSGYQCGDEMTVDWRNWIPRPGAIITIQGGPLRLAEYEALKAVWLSQYRPGCVPNRLRGAFIKEDGDAA